MKISKKSIAAISHDYSLRFDVKYLTEYENNQGNIYNYKYLFEIVDSNNKVYLDMEIPFKYAEIGNVNKFGEVFPNELQLSNRNELNEDLFKKIEKGDIFKPQNGNILISTIRPYLKKILYINEDALEDYTDIYFTKAFIEIKPKINNKILYYALRTIFIEKVNSVSRQGKGYPILKSEDLKRLSFPKKKIDYLVRHESRLIKEINKIEKEISILKSKMISKKDIIDNFLSKEFLIDLDIINDIEKNFRINVSKSSISNKNRGLRFSFRWNKMREIQKNIYLGLDNIQQLGKYIVQTNNGWSPQSVIGGEGTPILGQEHFNFEGKIDLNPVKFTLITRNDIEKFYINKGDFFVSRGNTVDLVGLAGVVEDDVEENIIYPDLYIRVKFNENINPKYIAIIFNSFIGRLYFKYVSKGKNQSMVKISKDELNNFYLPIPSIDQQNEIVNNIEILLAQQNDYLSKIESKYEEIANLFN
ncbi:restriction endonuclease subunit S [Calidifontibacillus erzurumensis]|uniref:Type I restriction enzyme S subunit n=1 Tax=Calidifontibacillus erzurumensis TaxID=2741433 RepID=A0A8J8KCP3_9BACI|nr:hypothetical protein [Calidifontibacillus erzurumensis]NSL53289.1 hypothetical protein [Calidifontibacillus erzurumensis]